MEPLEFRYVPGPISLETREKVFARDGYRCVVCGLGPKDGVGLGIGAFLDDGGAPKTVCWACLMAKGATEVQLRFQLPRRVIAKKLKRPGVEDRILELLDGGPKKKREIQRTTHLKTDEIESALSSMLQRGLVKIDRNPKDHRSVLVSLAQDKAKEA